MTYLEELNLTYHKLDRVEMKKLIQLNIQYYREIWAELMERIAVAEKSSPMIRIWRHKLAYNESQLLKYSTLLQGLQAEWLDNTKPLYTQLEYEAEQETKKNAPVRNSLLPEEIIRSEAV